LDFYLLGKFMPYLEYISDENLVNAVHRVINIAREAKKGVGKKFHSNVIDPFSAYFEAGGFKLSHEGWRNNEEARQAQKTLQNHVGAFHQKILGSIDGWEDLYVGGNIDLKCEARKIIAEIKNKHNTITGGKLVGEYESLERLIMPNASIYKGYTAYFVNIIPKKPIRSNKVFTPSDRDTSTQCGVNEKIRIIDGASFYDLATGQNNSLQALYNVLPKVIEDTYIKFYPEEKFTIEGAGLFSQYFKMAYGNNHD
jgi:hypothetical protein